MKLTREQVDGITIGRTKLTTSLGEPTTVVSIFCKREDIAGKLFVCGYREFGEKSRVSFSVKEDEENQFLRVEVL